MATCLPLNNIHRCTKSDVVDTAEKSRSSLTLSRLQLPIRLHQDQSISIMIIKN